MEQTLRSAGIGDPESLADWGVKERTKRQRDAVTRQIERQVPFAEAFARQFVADKFGMATTHWTKLDERIRRGVGNPCPLLLLGLPASCVEGYSAASPEL